LSVYSESHIGNEFARLITWTLYHSALSLDMPSDPLQKDSSLSLSEQIMGVVCQPAFIAGLGVAPWLALMGFSGWLYCRHRRRKELGHYTTSFAYTPAGIL
jgi:hypothetical protein